MTDEVTEVYMASQLQSLYLQMPDVAFTDADIEAIVAQLQTVYQAEAGMHFFNKYTTFTTIQILNFVLFNHSYGCFYYSRKKTFKDINIVVSGLDAATVSLVGGTFEAISQMG